MLVVFAYAYGPYIPDQEVDLPDAQAWQLIGDGTARRSGGAGGGADPSLAWATRGYVDAEVDAKVNQTAVPRLLGLAGQVYSVGSDGSTPALATISAPTSGKNLFDLSAAQSGYFWHGAYVPDHPDTSVGGYYASALIPVAPGQHLSINNCRNYEVLNASKANIFYGNNIGEGPVTAYVIPAGGAYLAINVSLANASSCQIEVGDACTAFEPYGHVVDRLLTDAGTSAKQLVADIAAQTPALRRLGGVAVHRSGNELLVRSAFDSTRDLLQPVTLSAGAESMVLLSTATNPNVCLIATTATDSTVWPAIGAAATAIHGPSDDNCPINVQFSYIGGNHGYSTTWNVTATAHGKTMADLGSTWSDGTRTYTLLAVPDANTLTFGASYSTSAGVSTASTIAPAASLTHVSGATHTTTVPIIGGVVAIEFHPSSFNHAVTVALDDRPLADGQKSYGQVLTIVETYQIVSYKAMIDWAQAHVGSAVATAIAAGSVSALCRISNTYRFTSAGLVVAQKLIAAEAMKVNMGVTQAIPLTIPAGGSKKQFMAGIGTAGGLNFSTLVDLSTMTGDIDVTPAAYVDPLTPATRMTQWAYNSGGAAQYGLAMGLLPVADGAPSQRVQNAATKSWFMTNSLKKNYPQIALNKTMAIGDTLAGSAYRKYLAPPDTTAEVVIGDGADTWAFLDRPSSATTDARMVAPKLLGKRLAPVGPVAVTDVPERVSGDGISYSLASAPGYGAWKAIDEALPPPSLFGAGRKVGNYFSFAAPKTAIALTGSFQILYLFPLTLPVETPIDRAILDCSTLGTGFIRHGVYAHDPSTGQPVPTAPLADFGTLDITTTGIKGDTNLPAVVTLPRVFWYGICWQTTNTTAPAIRQGTVPVYTGPIDLGSTPPVSSASSRLGYFMSGVTGAFGALSGLSTHALLPPSVIFRRAAA
jgi:hypothetical protein